MRIFDWFISFQINNRYLFINMSGTAGTRAANLNTLSTFKWYKSYFCFVLNNLFNNFMYSNNFVKIASNIKFK